MSDPNFDPPLHNITHRAASGFVFSIISQSIKILTQFISVVVMARLLNPADFGLMAMVWPVYSFAIMFGNLGLNQATIQRPHLTTQQVNAFFWINLAVGIVVCLFLTGLSPFVGMFYREPRTVAITIAMALLIPFNSLGNQHGALMIRKMDFRAQALLNIASCVSSLVGAIVYAYIFGGYWAIYAGLVAGAVASMAIVWISIPWRPSAPALAPETPEMLRFGLNITSANFMFFITGSINNIVIGRVMGERPLGLYERATKLLSVPLSQMTAPLGNVITPMLSRLHGDGDHYHRIFLRALGSITLAIAPGVIWSIAMPEVLIGKLMGQKWLETVPIFTALSFAALPQLINDTAGWLLTSQGRAKDLARWGLLHCIISVAALFAGLPFGILGVARILALSHIIRAPFLWWYTCRTGPVKLRHVAFTLMPQMAGCIVAYGLLKLLYFSEWLSGWLLLVIGLAISYAVTLLVMAILPQGREAIRRDYHFIWLMLKKALVRKPAEAS